MNDKQKIAIVSTASVMLIMLLFPPFQLVSDGKVLNYGYGFLFVPPYDISSVNIPLLLVQWTMAVIVGAIAWYFLRNAK